MSTTDGTTQYENNFMPQHTSTPNTPSNIKSILKIGSLNGRGLSKLSDPSQSTLFIKFLRSFQHDILCFQETHAVPSVHYRLNMQFQTNSSIWTPHCGIVSLDPLLTLHSLDINIDDRTIICKVTHTNAHFPPIIIANIYAPASRAQRLAFFAKLLDLPIFQHDTLNLDFEYSDFNYHAVASSNAHNDNTDRPPMHTPRNPQQKWNSLLTNSFFECTHSREEGPLLPTYRQGTYQSTIDYIFASPFLFQYLQNSSIEFINSDWTDHAILTTQFAFSPPHQGPGLWRGNPQLASNEHFTNELQKALDQYFVEHPLPFPLHSSPSFCPRKTWDTLKSLVKSVALRIGRRRSDWRHRQHLRLQRKRNKLLREYKSTQILHQRLPFIENMISVIQQTLPVHKSYVPVVIG
ncbi:hypothetical protein BD770DRAFT_457696, partial [Pilaira anomala]